MICSSLLIQVQGEYEVHEPRTIKYLQRVKDLSSIFVTLNMQ